ARPTTATFARIVWPLSGPATTVTFSRWGTTRPGRAMVSVSPSCVIALDYHAKRFPQGGDRPPRTAARVGSRAILFADLKSRGFAWHVRCKSVGHAPFTSRFVVGSHRVWTGHRHVGRWTRSRSRRGADARRGARLRA